ncbi:MAG: hypothetical protein Q4P33_01510 [Flaviflexus sp.]|nr:hypothetical protein [Flaviflexus sp.]
MTNVVFISPDFPQINITLVERASRAGLRMLGLGDADYDGLDVRLKESLTEYYRVPTLDSYDEVLRGVAFLTFKYGKIDVLESNNAYWLSQDGRLREDFNIGHGPTSRASDSESLEMLRDAGLEVGAPEGEILSYEALVGEDGEPLAEAATAWPAESAYDYTYRTLAEVPEELRALGRRATGVLDAELTFVHIQVAFPDGAAPRIIRASRSAAPAFTWDMHDHARQMDIYETWAHMLAGLDENLTPHEPGMSQPATPVQICIYASRQDGVAYAKDSLEIEATWSDQLRFVGRNPEQYRAGMGDSYYLAVVDTNEEADRFAADVMTRS